MFQKQNLLFSSLKEEFFWLLFLLASFQRNVLRLKPLMHGQIGLVRFVESNKFDNVYCKIWHIFVGSDQFDQMF